MQVFNEMGNKKKKIWEIKRRKNVRKFLQLHAFSFFKCKFLMTAKAMCLRIKVAQLNSLSVGKLPKYCNTWKCFTYSFEAEKQGEFFFFFFF